MGFLGDAVSSLLGVFGPNEILRVLVGNLCVAVSSCEAKVWSSNILKCAGDLKGDLSIPFNGDSLYGLIGIVPGFVGVCLNFWGVLIVKALCLG